MYKRVLHIILFLTAVMLSGCTSNVLVEQSEFSTQLESEYKPEPPSEEAPIPEPTAEPPIKPTEPVTEEQPETYDYVLNSNTMKFHYPSCSSVKTIKEKNRHDVNDSRNNIISQGYEPCGRCKP